MIKRRPVTRFSPPLPINPTLFLDIETLPAIDPWVVALLEEAVKVPGSMKKEETIATWKKEERPKLLKDAVSKSALDGTYGRVCCIGAAVNELPAVTFIGEESNVLLAFFEHVEKAFVTQDALGKRIDLPVTLVGHNLRAFDLRFIWQRSVILGIHRPVCLPWKVSRYDAHIQDTMELWNPDTAKRISLDKLCRVLGVRSPKRDFNGAMVAEAWARRQLVKIADYCAEDVEATRECWWKMQ